MWSNQTASSIQSVIILNNIIMLHPVRSIKPIKLHKHTAFRHFRIQIDMNLEKILLDANDPYQHLHKHKDLLGGWFWQRAASQEKKSKYRYRLK